MADRIRLEIVAAPDVPAKRALLQSLVDDVLAGFAQVIEREARDVWPADWTATGEWTGEIPVAPLLPEVDLLNQARNASGGGYAEYIRESGATRPAWFDVADAVEAASDPLLSELIIAVSTALEA